MSMVRSHRDSGYLFEKALIRGVGGHVQGKFPFTGAKNADASGIDIFTAHQSVYSGH